MRLAASIFICAFVVFFLPLPSNAFFGNYGLDYLTDSNTQNGQSNSLTRFSQNYFFGLNHAFTPALNSQFTLQYQNFHQTSVSGGQVLSSSGGNQSINPGLNLDLSNEYYKLTAGYTIQQTSQNTDFSNSKTDYDTFYSRLSTQLPIEYPSLLLQYTRSHQKNEFSNAPEQTTTNNNYEATSNYSHNWQKGSVISSLDYQHIEGWTGDPTQPRTANDNLNFTYNGSARSSYLENSLDLTATVQGAYGWSQQTQEFPTTGQAIVQRNLQQGLFTQGDVAPLFKPVMDPPLNPMSQLIDNDLKAPITSIDLAAQQYANIGVILTSSSDTVDRIYIYVNTDVTGDTMLGNPANWAVYGTTSNFLGSTWSQIGIKSVNITAVDRANSIFRYEIVFLSPQQRSVYNVVNQQKAKLIVASPVYVTEMQALAAVTISGTGKIVTSSTTYQQGANIALNYRPRQNVLLNATYSLNDNWARPNFPGVFRDFLISPFITTKNRDGLGASTVQRTYSSQAVWNIRPDLSATAQVSRNEIFDNVGTVDQSTNSYSVGLSAVPTPTIDTHLLLNRTVNYQFAEVTSTSNSATTGLGTQLYRTVHMTTDFTVAETNDEVAGTTTTTEYVTGALDSTITEDLFANANYALTWMSGFLAKQGGISLSYRPARFFTLTGNASATDSGSSTQKAAGLTATWFILPTTSFGASYTYSAQSQTSSQTPGAVYNTYTGYAVLNISRFLSLRMNAGYSVGADYKDKTAGFSLSGTI